MAEVGDLASVRYLGVLAGCLDVVCLSSVDKVKYTTSGLAYYN